MANLDKEIIAFKKLFNKPHTSPSFTLLGNEALDVGFQLSSKSIIAEDLPDPSSYTTLYDTDPNNRIERIRLSLTEIPNTGEHGFYMSLPSDYESVGNSNNPKAGTGNWVNGKALHETNGEIQIISTFLGGSNYQPKVYDSNDDEIEILNTDVNWIIYEFGGIYYQEGTPIVPPSYVECWIYIGDMVSDVSGGSGSTNLTANVEPIGTKDGINSSFDLPFGDTYIEGSLSVYLNGIMYRPESIIDGVSFDSFSISGDVLPNDSLDDSFTITYLEDIT